MTKRQFFFYANIAIAVVGTALFIASLLKHEWGSAILLAVLLVLTANGLRAKNRRPR